MEMKKYKLGEYLDSFGDGIHGTPKYDEYGDYYFINGNNLNDGKIEITSKTLKVSANEYEKIKRNLNEKSLLVSINGTLGNIAFYNGERIALGKSACFLNLKESSCREYLRYVLETKEFKSYMNRVASQSTIKNVSPTQISEFEFYAPSLPTQQKIAAVLSSLDDKITLNKKINTKLEAMAKRLYDYWFVQFDFPNEEGKPYKSSGGKMVWNEVLKREIPEEWEVKRLGDVISTSCERINTNDIKNQYYVPIEVIPRNKMSFHETAALDKAATGLCSFKKRSILLSNRRVYFHKVCISPFDGITRDTVIIINPKQNDNLGFVYQIVNSNHFIDYATVHSYGSEQPVLSTPAVLNYRIIYPNCDLDKEYSRKTESIISQVLQNELEIQKLTKLRDRLLPLLMNGQVVIK